MARQLFAAPAINHWLSFKARSQSNVVRVFVNLKLSPKAPERSPPQRALDHNTLPMLARVISFEILFLAVGCILLVGIAHWF